jgi:hypothetical protein
VGFRAYCAVAAKTWDSFRVIDLRDGRISRVQGFLDHAGALRAAGLAG